LAGWAQRRQFVPIGLPPVVLQTKGIFEVEDYQQLTFP